MSQKTSSYPRFKRPWVRKSFGLLATLLLLTASNMDTVSADTATTSTSEGNALVYSLGDDDPGGCQTKA